MLVDCFPSRVLFGVQMICSALFAVPALAAVRCTDMPPKGDRSEGFYIKISILIDFLSVLDIFY